MGEQHQKKSTIPPRVKLVQAQGQAVVDVIGAAFGHGSDAFITWLVYDLFRSGTLDAIDPYVVFAVIAGVPAGSIWVRVKGNRSGLSGAVGANAAGVALAAAKGGKLGLLGKLIAKVTLGALLLVGCGAATIPTPKSVQQTAKRYVEPIRGAVKPLATTAAVQALKAVAEREGGGPCSIGENQITYAVEFQCGELVCTVPAGEIAESLLEAAKK